jgi:hypothetical protein
MIIFVEWGRYEMHTNQWSENPNESEDSEDLDVDGRRIL